MADPYNYTLNVPNPAQSFMGGVQAGAGVAEMQAQRQQRDAAAQAAQDKATRSQQFQQALVGLGATPSAKQLSQLLVQFPEMSEIYKESYARLNDQEKQERLSQANTVYSAALSGDTELAKKYLQEYATAYRNSGREDDAKVLEAKAKLLESHPELTTNVLGSYLAEVQGPEKFAEAYSKQLDDRRKEALQKSDLTIKEKQAIQESVRAKYAESAAAQEAAERGLRIEGLAQDKDIKRANLAVLTAQAAYDKETNSLKKQELEGKLADAQAARDEKTRARTAQLETARGANADLREITNDLLNVPAGVLEDVTGPIDSRFPTLGTEEAAVEEKIKTLQNMVALGSVDKLTGAMSDTDILLLKNSIAALDPRAGAASLVKSFKKIQEIVDRNDKIQSKKLGAMWTTGEAPGSQGGAPATGGGGWSVTEVQ